jgi:hypothetical protein
LAARAAGIVALTIFSCLAIGCRSDSAAGTAAVDETHNWRTFGAPISQIEPVAAACVIEDPDRFVGKSVVIEGAPEQVCKNKGCWALFTSGKQQMRVKFKDYAFFIPTDSAGRTMRMEGILDIRVISEADARHFLEDAGDKEGAKRLNGDQRELTFVATGVRIR